MTTSRKTLFAVAIATALAAGLGTFSDASAQNSSGMYYQIGGGRPIGGATKASYNYSIGVSLKAGGNFSCSKFNLKENIANIMDNIADAGDDLQNAMVQAANSAIASLPALILQRVNPGLYDIFQNALLDAKARVNLSVASCSQMENDISNGRNPYENWVRWGRWSSWQDGIADNPGRATQIEEGVRVQNGRQGVPWICSDDMDGKAGGIGQRVITPIRDSVMAGFNVVAGRFGSGLPSELCSNEATFNSDDAPGVVGGRLGDAFERPQDAAEYAAQILGDYAIQTFDGGTEKQQLPGTGVLPYVERDSVAIEQKLTTRVQAAYDQSISVIEARQFSAPSLRVTDQTLNALRNFSATERTSLIKRLADEVAIARNVDKLLLIRRMLLTARDLAEIRNAPPALEAVNEAIAETSEQIDELMFESRLRREMVSQTALSVLEYEAEQRQRPVTVPTTGIQGGSLDGAPTRGASAGDDTP